MIITIVLITKAKLKLTLLKSRRRNFYLTLISINGYDKYSNIKKYYCFLLKLIPTLNLAISVGAIGLLTSKAKVALT